MGATHRLWVEQLEERVLLSVSSEFLAGALTVDTDAEDSIEVTELDGSVLVNGTNPGGSAEPVAAADVTSIAVTASGDYANIIDLSGVTPDVFTSLGSVSIDAGEGKDEVFGSAFDDVVAGGPGDDRIWGGRGNDYLDGGEGNDTIAGGAGEDTEIA